MSTLQRNKRRRLKKHGFRVRSQTKAGRRILKKRLKKGRKYLAAKLNSFK